jgi:kinetochore protein Nuf2
VLLQIYHRVTASSQRVEKQLANATEKLERAHRHAEEKKQANQKLIERVQQEYDKMVIERRENEHEMEAIRAQGDDIETKMAEHLKTSEAEINELLAEYWKLRHETGKSVCIFNDIVHLINYIFAADIYMETLADKMNLRVSSTKQ